MRNTLTTLAFLLPFKRLKVRLLNLLGHDIHPECYLGICVVRGVRKFQLAEGAGIGNFNVIGGIDRVEMGQGSRISYFNMITAGVSPEDAAGAGDPAVRGSLQLAANAHIISWHQLDCSGGVIVGEDCWITGVRSTILTHAFDPHEGRMIVEPVELKKGSVIATSCTMLPGTVVGEGALLAAGSTTWTRQELAASSLHGGVPARRLSPIEISDWVYELRRYSG